MGMGTTEIFFKMNYCTILDLYRLLINISLQRSYGWITYSPLLLFYYNYFTIS